MNTAYFKINTIYSLNLGVKIFTQVSGMVYSQLVKIVSKELK